MTGIDVQIEEEPTAEDADFVFRQLVGFNEARIGPASARPLTILARRGPEIVGGLSGMTHWNWLSIRYLWVAEELRRLGLGRRLVLMAEEEAVARGCEHVHLDTFSFQARPFYEGLGYVVFGALEDFPPGHSRFFLQKRNLPRIHRG